MNMRLVILLLGLALLVAVAGIVMLAMNEHPVPDVLQSLSVGALTGLAGVLARRDDAAVVQRPAA